MVRASTTHVVLHDRCLKYYILEHPERLETNSESLLNLCLQNWR